MAFKDILLTLTSYPDPTPVSVLDDAVSIAQTCTLVQSGDMAIEVRPLMEVKDIREFGDGQRTTGS